MTEATHAPYSTFKGGYPFIMKKTHFSLCFFACGALCAIVIGGVAHAQQALAPVTPQSFTLQIMTILDKFTADAELQKALKRGYKAYISEYTTQTGKVIYKLRCGKYPNRPAAVAAAKQYEAKEGASVMVVTAREDAPTGDVLPDATIEKKAAGKKTVRITVQDAEQSPRPSSLQEKVTALERGEMPEQKKKTSVQQPDDDGLWFTLQTNTEPDKRSAEHRINQLRQKGYDAYCVEAPMQNGKTQFKIRIGKFGSPEEAGESARQFSASERKGCMVVKIAPAGETESGPAVAPGAPVAAEKAQDEPVDVEPETPRVVKKPAQKTVIPDDEDQMPGAEMPSEPEPSQQFKKPAQKASVPQDRELPARTDNASETVEAADAPPAVAAPERMTKIYAFRQESGALNLTNKFEDIPEAARKNVEYISLFPVYILELAKKGPRLTVEVEGKATEIILAGFSIPRQTEPARAYLEALKTKPLRLKYSPWQTTKDGAIAGRLFLKEGSYINLDMVRKGLGECSVETLAPDQQEAFRQAQDAAKRERAGIWAN